MCFEVFSMISRGISFIRSMGCCRCFGLTRKPKRIVTPYPIANRNLSQELLLDIVEDDEDPDDFFSYTNDMCSYNGEITNTMHGDDDDDSRARCSKEIVKLRIQNGLICKDIPARNLSQELLLDIEEDDDDPDDCFSNTNVTRSYNGETTNTMHGDDDEIRSRARRSEEVVKLRIQNGLICRDIPVREVHTVVRGKDKDGKKTVNEYVRERKIGAGSYGKVVLYRSRTDGKYYAIKSFHKFRLLNLRVAPSETAMTDVLREVLIMKTLRHPNIVNLVEVIDDPSSDNFYMVLEYVESKWVCRRTGHECSLDEKTARKYLRDIVAGLMYLHAHNIVHGDIKPDNLLISSSGTVKIGDFGVSQVFEDDRDELRRSPGTPVFTAPECCLGFTYHGKAADVWAVGVTLYCMIMGQYPFIGHSLQDTYDKIINDPIVLQDNLNPHLKNLIEGLLCKDPYKRLTLKDVAEHQWVISEDGPIPKYICWCKQGDQANNQLFLNKLREQANAMNGNGETNSNRRY